MTVSKLREAPVEEKQFRFGHCPFGLDPPPCIFGHLRETFQFGLFSSRQKFLKKLGKSTNYVFEAKSIETFQPFTVPRTPILSDDVFKAMDKNNDGQISKVKSLPNKRTVLFRAFTFVSGRAEAGQEEPDDEANRVDHQEAG